MLGFEINGHAVLNAPVFIVIGFAVGLATQLIGFAISTKRSFLPSQWVAGPAAAIAMFFWVSTQPGWFGASCGVSGILISAVVVSLIRDRRVAQWLKSVTGVVVIGLCLSVSFWHNSAMNDAISQLRSHNAATLESYAATGAAQRFVAENYVTCLSSPVGYEAVGNLKFRWSEPVYAPDVSCLAATMQIARSLHSESFAKEIYNEASKGLIEFKKAHSIDFQGEAKVLIDSVRS